MSNQQQIRSDFVGTWSSPPVSHRRVIWPNPETLWWLWWVTESFGVFSCSRYLLLLCFTHPIQKSFSSFRGWQPSRPSRVSKSQWLMESFLNRKFERRGSMTLRVIWTRLKTPWIIPIGYTHLQEERKKSRRRKEVFKKTKEVNQQVLYPLAPRPW